MEGGRVVSPAETGLLIGQIFTTLLGGGGLLAALINKKARTPADDQARIAFGVSILEKQLERSQQDAARWLEVERFLREQIARLETSADAAEGAAEEARTLLTTVREQLREVTAERDELQRRIGQLAIKHTQNEPITLEDILGTQHAVQEATA